MSRMKSVTTLAVALGLVAGSIAYAQGGSTTGSTEQKAAAPATHAKSAMKASVAKYDLNSASKEELMKLSGVDEAIADKIIAGRPFKNRADLLSKGIVSKEAYAKISGHIFAKKMAVAAK